MALYVPLSKDAHTAKRWRAPTDWRFAADAGLVACVMSEAAALATAMPLVFHKQEAEWQLMALLRLTPHGQGPFAGPDGSWRAGQIPQALRSYPFTSTPTGDGRFALLVDEESGLVDADGDYELFDESGELAAELAQLVQTLEVRNAALPVTAQAISALEQAGLLSEISLVSSSETPLFGVDAARLQSLSGDALTGLHAAHAIGLAYVQIVSLHNLPWLRKATAHVQQAAVASTQEGAEIALTTASFLSALADAQGYDFQDPTEQFLSDLTSQSKTSETKT
jgi:hypothetical protein